MSEPVVITESEYGKGEAIFAAAGDAISWSVCAADEGAVESALTASGSRIAVLGVDHYRDAAYDALKRNAKGGPSLIARYGVGYDGIDLERCLRQDTYVAITPGALDQSVAEYAIALLLGVARKIVESDGRVRRDEFSARMGVELYGKLLGIVGLGKIGKAVARIAHFGLGMRVVAFDVLPIGKQASMENKSEGEFLSSYGLDEYATDFGAVARKADFLSLHMPLSPATRSFLNRERIALIKPGAVLINTSRGGVLDERALCESLRSGTLSAAALDVFQNEPYEPVSPDSDLRTFSNVVLGPHAASNTTEANERMQRKVLENIRLFLDGRFEELPTVGR